MALFGGIFRNWLREAPKVEAALDKLDDNHPIGAAITRGVTGFTDREDNALTPADAEVIVQSVKAEIAAAPVARAEANVTRWYEDRYKVAAVVWLIGFVASLFHLNIAITPDDVVNYGPIIQAVGAWIFGRAASVELPPWDWRHPLRSLLGLRRLVTK